jgi:hypothetical protein
VTLIMFTSVNLVGKKQCIYDKEGKVDTNIIVKLVKLLGPPRRHRPKKENLSHVKLMTLLKEMRNRHLKL